MTEKIFDAFKNQAVSIIRQVKEMSIVDAIISTENSALSLAVDGTITHVAKLIASIAMAGYGAYVTYNMDRLDLMVAFIFVGFMAFDYFMRFNYFKTGMAFYLRMWTRSHFVSVIMAAKSVALAKETSSNGEEFDDKFSNKLYEESIAAIATVITKAGSDEDERS